MLKIYDAFSNIEEEGVLKSALGWIAGIRGSSEIMSVLHDKKEQLLKCFSAQEIIEMSSIQSGAKRIGLVLEHYETLKGHLKNSDIVHLVKKATGAPDLKNKITEILKKRGSNEGDNLRKREREEQTSVVDLGIFKKAKKEYPVVNNGLDLENKITYT